MDFINLFLDSVNSFAEHTVASSAADSACVDTFSPSSRGVNVSLTSVLVVILLHVD